jgi:hypothetical protein
MNIGIHSREADLQEPNTWQIGNSQIPVGGVLFRVQQVLIAPAQRRTENPVIHPDIGCAAQFDFVHVHKDVQRFLFRSSKKVPCFSQCHGKKKLTKSYT